MAKRATGTLMTRSRNLGPEEKAIFHNDLGAGRSKVVREFVGLDAADEAAVVSKAEQVMADRLGDQFR